MPGEKSSPTQPFPTKPAPFDRQGIGIDDLIDFTPALRAEALEVIKRYRIGPLFTPPVFSNADGPLATLQVPADTAAPTGRAARSIPRPTASMSTLTRPFSPSASCRPIRRRQTWATCPGSAQPGGRAAADVAQRRAGPAARQASLRSNHRVRHGHGRDGRRLKLDAGRDHEPPGAEGPGPAAAGQPGRTFIGILATRTLLIAGEGGVHTNAAGERVALLRAYDKATGADVGAVNMPAAQTGSPMTYMINGRQYIVVAVSGVNGAALIAYALPQ